MGFVLLQYYLVMMAATVMVVVVELGGELQEVVKKQTENDNDRPDQSNTPDTDERVGCWVLRGTGASARQVVC